MGIKKTNSFQVAELISLFVFSAALMSIQASFTKFFSIVMWYHFGFMIISVAMLGFSVSGVFLSLTSDFSKRFSFSHLILVSSVTTYFCYGILTRISFTPINVIVNGTGLSTLIFMILLLFIPFFLYGLTIGWLLKERKEIISIYYSLNMTGSAVGALIFIFLFNTFNGQIVIPLTVLVMVVSALLAADTINQKIVCIITGLLVFPTLFFPSLFPMEPPGDKILGLVKDRKEDVVYTGWSALSKVDAIKDPDRSIYQSIGLWGISPVFYDQRGINPERTGVVIDSWAYTSILKYPQELTFFNYLPSTLVYNLGTEKKSSLHIGSGGGMDLLAAKHFGIKKITGVEINPVIVKLVQNEFRKYSGGIYSNKIEGIDIIVDEGRNFIESSENKYDIIQLSGVDTFSSTHAGAFALSENNLYSVEAFKSYFSKLNEDGYFTMTSWFAPDEKGVPRFSIRLLNIAKQALSEIGLNPLNRVIFIVSDVYTLLVVKKGGFTPDEAQMGEDYIKKNRFISLIHPFKEPNEDNIFEKFLYADDKTSKKLISEYPYIVSPPTDDKPFFFELRKIETLFSGINSGVLPLNIFSGQTILFGVLSILSFLGLILIIQPLYFLKKKNKTELKLHNLLYFSFIGLGFMFVEIVLTQKFVLYLGHPSYSLSIALFSILFFSGLGSFASSFSLFRKKEMLLILSGIIFLFILFLSSIISKTLGYPFYVRILITLAVLAPLSFFMGIAFPAGAEKTTKNELPFLWGVNGFFSVIASVSATIISINFGFTFVFYISFVCYFGAALIMFFKFKHGAGNE